MWPERAGGEPEIVAIIVDGAGVTVVLPEDAGGLALGVGKTAVDAGNGLGQLAPSEPVGEELR